MILESFNYTRQTVQASEWAVQGKGEKYVVFENINLIVGKNAAGKSRLLETIQKIASLLSLKESVVDLKFPSVKYDIILKEADLRYNYVLEIENKSITEETLSINGVEKYNRKKNLIYSEIENKNIELNIEKDSLITKLNDRDQDFPYISEIFEWSNALKRYVFTNQYEKSTLLQEQLVLDKVELGAITNTENIIQLFAKGQQLFGRSFEEAIIQDLNHIGYDITAIDLFKSMQGTGISVKEEDLKEPTLQVEMSQGMFRALSFIIQLNFALLSKVSLCLLIDDLGEGLDFSRSKSLIDLLIHKIEDSDIQIFITTNDRYVMNRIPLRYWSVVERKPKVSIFHNYHNSKDIFDDFKFTGLSNFDFLATDFFLNGFGSESEA